MPDARPIHRVYVDGFFMDKTDVTNEEFAKFVKATGYRTVAEIAPTQEEFPTAPKTTLLPDQLVFTPTPHAVSLNNIVSVVALPKRRQLAASGRPAEQY